MGVKSFFRKFWGGAQKVFNAIQKGFVILFGAEALEKFEAAARALFASSFGSVVLGIVSELQYEKLSNAEKREAAIKQILAQAKSEGLELKESLARLLVELAVQRLKGLAS